VADSVTKLPISLQQTNINGEAAYGKFVSAVNSSISAKGDGVVTSNLHSVADSKGMISTHIAVLTKCQAFVSKELGLEASNCTTSSVEIIVGANHTVAASSHGILLTVDRYRKLTVQLSHLFDNFKNFLSKCSSSFQASIIGVPSRLLKLFVQFTDSIQ
jgi:hypothetical protein